MAIDNGVGLNVAIFHSAIFYCDAKAANLKYATTADRIKTIINIGSILYSFFRACTNMPANIIEQKAVAARGVKIGTIPKSHGTIMPIHPNNSRTPNIRIGIIELFGFKCPSATCFSLLPVIFP